MFQGTANADGLTYIVIVKTDFIFFKFLLIGLITCFYSIVSEIMEESLTVSALLPTCAVQTYILLTVK